MGDEMNRFAEQRNVLRGIAAALAIIALWFTAAWVLWPLPSIADTPAARLAFALKWDLAVVACLVVAVGLAAQYSEQPPV